MIGYAFFIALTIATTLPHPVDAKGMPCGPIRAAVKFAGQQAAEDFARSQGYDQTWIDRARKCLRTATAK